MNRTTTMMIAALGTAALCACASMRGADRQEPIERLDERGASAQVLEVAAGSRLHFVNADTASHEIYSNDCAELSDDAQGRRELRHGRRSGTEAFATSRICSRRFGLSTPAP